MEKSTINNLREDSVFWDNYFLYKVTKVYKHGTIVHGVQAAYTWKNDFGTFSKKIYLSKRDLLADEYNCDEEEANNELSERDKILKILKPCPFCGNEAEIITNYRSDKGYTITVGCPKGQCFCRIKKNLWFDFNEEIIQYNIKVMVEKWNTRI